MRDENKFKPLSYFDINTEHGVARLEHFVGNLLKMLINDEQQVKIKNILVLVRS